MNTLCILLTYVGYVLSAPELLKNADFESSDFNGNWMCSACHISQSHDAQHGHSSVMVSHRTHDWSGIQQMLVVQPGHRYVFKGYIKLLNSLPGHQAYRIKLMLQTTDSNGHVHHNFVGDMQYAQLEFGWFEIGFDYTVNSDVHKANLKIQLPDIQVNYLVDNFSFQELPDDSSWKTKANNRIEQLRKADIHISTRNPSGINTNSITLQLHQNKSKFAFGTAVSATYIVDPGNKPYQDFVYNNFEWVVLENALKWRLMEWTKGHPNFDKPMTAINALKAKGMKVRGHNMFWAGDSHVPKFLNGMSSAQLIQTMHTHVNDMIAHTRGKLEHWDVNNEKLHGNFYARHSGNVNITQDMFKWIHNEEPGVKLFLNDYNIVNNGLQTTAYKNQGKQFRESGVPIYGMGVQSHLKSSHLDMTAIKYRLDKAAEAGLPIWITELSIKDENANNKADALEDIYTLYFSHPSVEGILLWGFSDVHIFDHAATLTNGHSVSPNAAGQRYQELFKQRWRTIKTLQFATQTVRAFKGDYTLTVIKDGHVTQTHQFTLDNSHNITITI